MGTVAPAIAFKLHVVVKLLRANASGYLVAHVHVGIHGFHAHGDGNRIVELEGQGGHKRQGLNADVINISSASPVAGKAVAKAETRKNAQANPGGVAQLMAGIGVGSIPEGGLGIGVGLLGAILGGNAARRADKGKAAHKARAGQLGYARCVVGNGRNVIGASYHATSQRNTPGAPFIEGETFTPGHGRAANHEGQRQTYRTKNLHQFLH